MRGRLPPTGPLGRGLGHGREQTAAASISTNHLKLAFGVAAPRVAPKPQQTIATPGAPASTGAKPPSQDK